MPNIAGDSGICEGEGGESLPRRCASEVLWSRAPLLMSDVLLGVASCGRSRFHQKTHFPSLRIFNNQESIYCLLASAPPVNGFNDVPPNCFFIKLEKKQCNYCETN
jgi:hypothetical protein